MHESIQKEALNSGDVNFFNFVFPDMFAEAHSPDTLAPEELDHYLDRGWFRMGHTVFTTNFLNFRNEFCSAMWLRVGLKTLAPDKTGIKLKKRNSGFRTSIVPFVLTPEKEALYAEYKKGITFDTSPSLQTLMYGNSFQAPYHTLEVTVHDGDKLIACGFFDLGFRSAAGITCFYDPAYKKYSLGKYLMYVKIDYCRELGLDYFYPGYFLVGSTFFDYKLSIGKNSLEYFYLPSRQWLPVAAFTPEQSPLQQMTRKLLLLQQALSHAGITSPFFLYEFFDANLIPELRGIELFDFPAFLLCEDFVDYTIKPMVVYDVRDGHYHIVQCLGLWTSEAPAQAERYASHLLKLEQHLYSSPSPQDIASWLQRQKNIHIKSSTPTFQQVWQAKPGWPNHDLNG